MNLEFVVQMTSAIFTFNLVKFRCQLNSIHSLFAAEILSKDYPHSSFPFPQFNSRYDKAINTQ